MSPICTATRPAAGERAAALGAAAGGGRWGHRRRARRAAALCGCGLRFQSGRHRLRGVDPGGGAPLPPLPRRRALLPLLAEWLCANDGKDERATRLLRDAHLFILPTMNPDGFKKRRRGNAKRFDLNRNFPDPVKHKGTDLRAVQTQTQPEVAAIMELMLSRTWAGAANFHEGAEVVVYSYDGYASGTWRVLGRPHPAPDDATFVHLSRVYADAHTTMARSKAFPGGIINGASWYPIYVAAGCMDFTIEASKRKFRRQRDLPVLWAENREALLALPIAAAFGGARGQVRAADTNATLAATLTAAPATPNGYGPPVPFYASKGAGFYARPLAPGKYTLVASAPGYAPAEAAITVPADGRGVAQDFLLAPAARR
ncbi:MAG: hypothetical protein J3K34DRAFT_410572 [Monoraphidium minutum]|nr:MAG: hypothetical protein J3K34DRAFT_410572 [Monoraphidium minutum]